MSLTLLRASATLDVHYDHENSWLYLDWKGPQALTQVQADCLLVTRFMRQTGAHKVLNDNSGITHTACDLASWVTKVYLPAAGRAGLDFVAWVASPVLKCRRDTNLLLLSVEYNPQLAVFDDIAAAYSWLRSMHVPGTRLAA